MSIVGVIVICLVELFLGVGITNIINTNSFKKQSLKKEKEYEDRIARLEEKCNEVTMELKGKDEFIANMVHDIRTPINAVNGMTELILRENNNSVVNEYANSIKRTGNVLNQLVNDVLDISKIESGNMELVEDTYDIVEIFSDVITLIKDKCNKKHLKFEVRIDENIPCVMYGDENRLRQILMNLLSNAVKYTADGKVLFEAKLKGDIDKDMAYVYFAVEDTGSG